MHSRLIAVLMLGISTAVHAQEPPPPAPKPAVVKGRFLETLAWPEAARELGAAVVVVLPMGAASRQHGHHLPLNTDAVFIEHLRQAIASRADVVIAPTLSSTTDRLGEPYPATLGHTLRTIRDLVVETCAKLARGGPKRFLLVAADAAALEAFTAASQLLAADGILLRSVDAIRLAAERPIPPTEIRVTHADEIETSIMLAVDRRLVDMTRAQRSSPPMDIFARVAAQQRPTETGVRGDPTKATAEAGSRYLQVILDRVLKEIEEVRAAPTPSASPRPTATAPSGPAPAGVANAPGNPDGAERSIRRIALQFETAWRQKDAWSLADLWTETGDVGHPDGLIEKGRQTIAQNRTRIFATREHRMSRHPLGVGPITFLSSTIAVVDGTWEMNRVITPQNMPAPATRGPFTMVVVFDSDTSQWKIAAYRYMLSAVP